jgi:two-component system, NarL family, sensor kinase
LKSEFSQRNPEADRLLDDTSSMIEEMTRQVRTLSYLLHPPLLDEAGIASAVQWYVEGFGARSNIEVSLEFPPELGRLSQDLEITIFRLIQEALTNIHRHSGSKTASIRVVQLGNELRVEIADAGKGLGARLNGNRDVRLGVGILGMKERVSLLGGSLEISSSGSGTSVLAILPASPVSV